MATVTEIREVVPTVRFEDPYQIFATGQDPHTGQVRIFKTSLRDPALFPVGSSMTFLVDPDDPTNYYPAFWFEPRDEDE